MEIVREVVETSRFGRKQVVEAAVLPVGYVERIYSRDGQPQQVIVFNETTGSISRRFGIRGFMAGGAGGFENSDRAAEIAPVFGSLVDLESDRNNRVVGVDRQGREVIFRCPDAPDNSFTGKAMSRVAAVVNRFLNRAA